MKNKMQWPYTLITPIVIIICQFLIIADTDTKDLGIICGIIIGIHIMLIIDCFFDKKRKKIINGKNSGEKTDF